MRTTDRLNACTDELVTVELLVSNTGATALGNISIFETFPAGSTYVAGSITGPGANAANAANAGGGGSSSLTFSKNATVNFELDKTVRHTRGASGVVKRLAVAVILNNKLDPVKGKAAPLTDTELKQATALAKEAVGFNKDRGDTVNVANVAFAPREQELIPDTPLWKDPWLIPTAKDIGKLLLFVFLAWLLWTRAFKPLFEMLAGSPRCGG